MEMVELSEPLRCHALYDVKLLSVSGTKAELRARVGRPQTS